MTIVPIPGLGEIGVVGDIAPQDVPINGFTRVLNMRFRDGYAQRFGGLGLAEPLTQPSVAPYCVQAFNTPTGRFWIYAGLDAVYADDGTTLTEITGTTPTGGIDDRWTMTVLSGVLVINNGVDVPQYWAGTGTLADLPGWNAAWRCKSLRAFKAYLVGVGWTISGDARPHLVKWSAAAEPGAVPTSWDETDPTLDAGEVDQAETPDEMVDQLVMGDVNVLYKDQSMYAMRYVGAPQIFQFQRLPGDVGSAAPGCMVATPVGHVVLTYGDVVLHNAQGPQSILDGRMRKWLRVRLSTDHFQRSFLAVNTLASEVWVCFPEPGETNCTMALVWNWKTSLLGVRELPGITYAGSGRMPVASSATTWATLTNTWAEAMGAWIEADNNASEVRMVLAREAEPGLLLADQGEEDDGTAFAAYLERSGLAFSEPEAVKTCKRVFLRVDAPTGSELFVEIGAAMTAEESPVYEPPVSYIVGSSYQVDCFATGRFLAYRITSGDLNVRLQESSGEIEIPEDDIETPTNSAFPWRIASLEFDIVKRGRY